MRRTWLLFLIASAALTICATAWAADKPDYPTQLHAAKNAIEETAAKVGNYPLALAEIEKARASLKRAEQAYDKGHQWMGLGGLKPEAEQEVKHNLLMVEMATTLAGSRAAKGRNEEEAAVLDKQLAALKARVKLLEDRKAEEERLRLAAQKGDAATKELAGAKADNAKLLTQIEQLTADKKKLDEQISALTAEKNALAAQLETFKKAAPPATSPPPAVPK